MNANQPNPETAVPPSDLLFATMIVQGLLSTSQYTRPCCNDDDGPQILTDMHGNDWKAEGFCQQMEYMVIVDALDILKDLKKAIAHERLK